MYLLLHKYNYYMLLYGRYLWTFVLNFGETHHVLESCNACNAFVIISSDSWGASLLWFYQVWFPKIYDLSPHLFLFVLVIEKDFKESISDIQLWLILTGTVYCINDPSFWRNQETWGSIYSGANNKSVTQNDTRFRVVINPVFVSERIG